MTSTLRSKDLSEHASIGLTLTDRKIDAYMLRGFYGLHLRKKLLKLIQSGVVKSLDARIRKNEFGDEALQALNARTVKKRKKSTSTLTAEDIAEYEAFLGLNSNLLDCND